MGSTKEGIKKSTKNNKNKTVVTKKKKEKKVVNENINETKKEDEVISEKAINIDNKKVVKEEKKKSNKMIYIVLAIIVILFLIIYFVTKDKTDEYGISPSGVITNPDSALALGEKKYREFLWLVDGAFNDSRYNNHLKVNNKVVDGNVLDFKCEYDKDKVWCKGENFEKAFSTVFANNITYKDVYGDGLAYDWYEKREDGYYFKNPNGCNISRMNENQTIELTDEKPERLVFKIQYTDNMKTGIYAGEHKIVREFILVREGKEWKVSTAHYHDLCFQDYYIPKQY